MTLEVYNVLGQKIATLVDAKHAVGNYRVTWDGRDVPSGVYLYRLKTEGFIKTLKMVLMK